MGGILGNPEFWVGIAFVITIALLWWKGAGMIAEMLDARSARIRDELEEARRLRETAEQALEEYRRRQKDAIAEAQEIAARAAHEAERLAAQSARDLEATIKRREELARDRIAQAEAAALAAVRAAAVDVAIAAARRLIAESLDEARGAQLIDAAIRDLPQRLH